MSAQLPRNLAGLHSPEKARHPLRGGEMASSISRPSHLHPLTSPVDPRRAGGGLGELGSVLTDSPLANSCARVGQVGEVA